jgi:tight adherence protein C
MPTVKAKLYETLVAAGNPNAYTSDEFLAVAMLWGLILGALLEGANLLVGHGFSLAMPIIGFLAGVAIVIYNLHSSAATRVRLIGRRVPYTLDLVSLAMGAGATFTEAVRTVIREDAKHPFNVELNTVLAEVELGTTRAQALRNMSDRVPLESLRSIVASIIQAEGLGTPLSDVLKGQASLMRLQRSVRAEKLAAAASVRILVPSLLILMSVVLTVFAPIIIRAVKGELF